MATIINAISLDVSQPNLIPPVQAKQFDTDSRFLDVTVLQNGTKITVDSGATVYLNIERADHERNSYNGTVNEDGTVRVPLTRWALSLADIVKGSVSILQSNARLTTLNFTIDVQEAESDDAPSPDPPDIWQQALLDIAELKVDVAALQNEVGDINTILATLVTVGE